MYILLFCAKKQFFFFCLNACHYAMSLAVYELSHKHQIHPSAECEEHARLFLRASLHKGCTVSLWCYFRRTSSAALISGTMTSSPSPDY